MRRRRAGITITEVLVVVFVLCLLFTLLAPALMKTHCGSPGEKCSNNLKQIALAAIQYADERRFFPHVASLRQLDGGPESTTSAQCIRALTFYNYCDNPESYVCPASSDEYVPLRAAAKTDIRRFAWGNHDNEADLAKSPLYEGRSVTDLPLAQMTDLSYGWTRRGFTSNSVSSEIVVGDRAARALDGASDPSLPAGNHKAYLFVAHVDGHVSRLAAKEPPVAPRTVTFENVASVESSGGGLGLLR